MLTILASLGMLLPGFCWWVWCGRRDQDGVETLAKILGVSISLQAVGALILFLLNLSLSTGWLLGIYALFFILTVYRIRKKQDIRLDLSWLGAIFLFAIFIAWRLYQAKALVLPAWVDSLHHVLIVRKILEVGTLPADLTPYLQGPFYYHFAFHTSTANFAALSSLAPAQAVLLWGQVISAGIGLSVYSLGKALFKNWRFALAAAFLVTFATKMPAYYLSWGRYTLLTGMLLLPLAMASAVKSLQEEGYKEWLGLVLLTAGTLLAHYFTAVLLAFFLIILGAWFLIRCWKLKEMVWKPLLGLSLTVLLGLLLVLPWLLRVFANTGMSMTPVLNLPESIEGYLQNKDQWKYLWYLLAPQSGQILVGLAVLGLILAFTKRNQRPLAAWSLVFMLLALPWGIKLGSFRYDHFAIILFLPVCMLAAGALELISERVEHLVRQKWVANAVFAISVLILVVLGGIKTANIINKTTILANQADLDALEWIDANTPQDARFFTNTAGWGYGVWRGVDGGAWILPVTGRGSLAPTVFYVFSGQKDYINKLNDWGARASTVTQCDEAFWSLMAEAELTHVYLREGTGSLTAAYLESCAGLKKIYDSGGVSMWEIDG